jgi:hypothetical protein
MIDVNPKNGIDDALDAYASVLGIGGGTATDWKTSIVKVPVPTYMGPSGQSGVTGAPLFAPSTVSDAVINFYGEYSKNTKSAQNIVDSLVQTGMIRPGSSLEKIASAYENALILTAKINVKNPGATIFDAMSMLGSGDKGTGVGGTYKDFVKYTDQQLTDKATSAFNSILGRPPTVEESKAFAKAMKAGAQAAPSIRKVSGSGKTTVNQSGFDENAFVAGYMSNHIPEQATELDGMAGQVQDLIDKYKHDYGIAPTAGFINSSIKGIISSKDRQAAQDNLEQQMKEQAQVLFPALKDKINAGLSVRAIADPFINVYSKLMEKNDMTVDLQNSEIVKALSFKNDKGEYQMPTVDDFARDIRKKPEWLETRNATESYLSAADGILKQFGFRR